jgi:hypothetical protein
VSTAPAGVVWLARDFDRLIVRPFELETTPIRSSATAAGGGGEEEGHARVSW